MPRIQETLVSFFLICLKAESWTTLSDVCIPHPVWDKGEWTKTNWAVNDTPEHHTINSNRVILCLSSHQALTSVSRTSLPSSSEHSVYVLGVGACSRRQTKKFKKTPEFGEIWKEAALVKGLGIGWKDWATRTVPEIHCLQAHGLGKTDFRSGLKNNSSARGNDLVSS